MRLIDAEWLKLHFPHDADWDYPVNTNSYVVELIDEAPTIEASTWIPCNERLPNEKERIESYIRDERASEFIVMIKGANRPTTLYLSWDNYWFDDNRNFYEVVAWMLLPKPYKESDDE